MIDLHNHILPGIDDGARDLAEALDMARTAVSVGTTHMAATPHRFYRGREIEGGHVAEQVEKLQSALKDASIPLKLIPGLEIPIGPDTASGLIGGVLPRLGGPTGTHALIETPFEHVPANGLPILEKLLEGGIVPILAHPERNDEIQRHLAFVEAAASLGIVIQLTSGSLVGHFGPLAEATARRIVERREWTIIIASDAHWRHDRTAEHLRTAAERAGEWLGDPEAGLAMVTSTPATCLGPGWI